MGFDVGRVGQNIEIQNACYYYEWVILRKQQGILESGLLYDAVIESPARLRLVASFTLADGTAFPYHGDFETLRCLKRGDRVMVRIEHKPDTGVIFANVLQKMRKEKH